VTPELIIAIATAALAIATFVLAFVTARMARETRRTAAAAVKALELEQMPILGVRNLRIEITPHSDALRLGKPARKMAKFTYVYVLRSETEPKRFSSVLRGIS